LYQNWGFGLETNHLATLVHARHAEPVHRSSNKTELFQGQTTCQDFVADENDVDRRDGASAKKAALKDDSASLERCNHQKNAQKTFHVVENDWI
jgi:hypothetical protein